MGKQSIRYLSSTYAAAALLAVSASASAAAAPTSTARPSQADVLSAAAALGFTVKAGKVFDDCDEQVSRPAVVDLNNDGRAELIFANGLCRGGNAGWFGIAHRLPSGTWHEILSSQGVYEVLPARHQGWPDIRVGGPGCSGNDPRYGWNGAKYVVAGRTPRHCTEGATEPTPLRPATQRLVSADSNPAWTAFKAGSFRFTGSSPETCARYQTMLPAESAAIRIKDWTAVARGLIAAQCGADIAYFTLGLAAVNLYSASRDRAYEAAALAYYQEAYRIGNDRTAQPFEHCRGKGHIVDCNGINTVNDSRQSIGLAQSLLAIPPVRQADVSATMVATPPPLAPTVWSLGRARYLVERGQRCAPEASLGTPYCFGQAIGWLQRHSDKQAIDVVAMESSWALGSMIPHNNGQGWDIYHVTKNGGGFAASKTRHFGTQVRLPLGCMYNGVADQAWFITVASGRKTAVEAARYLCSGWREAPMYTRYLDTGDLDAAPGDLSLGMVSTTWSASSVSDGSYRPSTQAAQAPRQPQSAATSGDYDIVNGTGAPPAFRQDYSGQIYGSPNDPTPAPKPKKKHR